MEEDLSRALIVVVLGFALGLIQMARFDPLEKTLLRVALLAHAILAFVHILIMGNVIIAGDLNVYTADGERLAQLLRLDFSDTAPSMLALVFHQMPDLDLGTSGYEGGSTGTMSGIAAWLVYLTGGSTYTLGTIISMAAYFGQVALYDAFRSEFPIHLRRRLLFAAMLVPSAIFWSAALMKEGVAMIGLGHAVLGMVRFRRRATGRAAARLLLGALPVGLAKPYILLAFVFAGAVWLYADAVRASRRAFKTGYVLLTVAIGLVGLLSFGSLFPSYAISSVVDQATTQHALSAHEEGGSNFTTVDEAEQFAELSLAEQIVYAPGAILTAIYRPSILDSTKPQIAVNAVETTILLVLTFRALRRKGLRGAWAITSSTPMLMFTLVFSIVLGLGVGLSTTNFGTLSRYRMPLVPFFWALILVLDSRRVDPGPVARVP